MQILIKSAFLVIQCLLVRSSHLFKRTDEFYILHFVDRASCNDSWLMTNVMHKFSSVYLFLLITLYMFRAHRAYHQERQIVSIQPLVTVILCWWSVIWVSCHVWTVLRWKSPKFNFLEYFILLPPLPGSIKEFRRSLSALGSLRCDARWQSDSTALFAIIKFLCSVQRSRKGK